MEGPTPPTVPPELLKKGTPEEALGPDVEFERHLRQRAAEALESAEYLEARAREQRRIQRASEQAVESLAGALAEEVQVETAGREGPSSL